ncbi:MAG: polysaccharide deacetylase family protein [Gemmatimonadaceae bacterium]
MIRLDAGIALATPAQRWALDVLVDLAALVRVDDPAADVVTLSIATDGERIDDMAAARAHGWGIRVEDGRVLAGAGALTLVARIAAAADEQLTDAADRHGRVPPSQSIVVREGVEREPVVHEAARSLREAVIAAAGRRLVRFLSPWPDGRRWAVALAHDVDVVAAWPAFAAMRWLELVRGGHPGRAARAVRAAAGSALGAPVRRAVQTILATEARHDVRATWFFLCGTPTVRTIRRGDLTYSPESRSARRLLATVGAAGHEVGLHGSFATWRDPATMAGQRDRLAALAGRPVEGIRQHFLRMRPGETQRAMTDAGFRYDATFGFSDRNGFRLGVADVLGGFFDYQRDEPLALDVVPLVWMDRALSKYRGIEDPERWIDDALALAAVSRAVGGLWSGLWHPNLTDALGYPDAPRAFERLVRELVAGDPFVAPTGELVAWRSARRAVRVARLAPDGRAASGPPSTDRRIGMEDSDGRPDAELSHQLYSTPAESQLRGGPPPLRS